MKTNLIISTIVITILLLSTTGYSQILLDLGEKDKSIDIESHKEKIEKEKILEQLRKDTANANTSIRKLDVDIMDLIESFNTLPDETIKKEGIEKIIEVLGKMEERQNEQNEVRYKKVLSEIETSTNNLTKEIKSVDKDDNKKAETSFDFIGKFSSDFNEFNLTPTIYLSGDYKNKERTNMFRLNLYTSELKDDTNTTIVRNNMLTEEKSSYALLIEGCVKPDENSRFGINGSLGYLIKNLPKHNDKNNEFEKRNVGFFNFRGGPEFTIAEEFSVFGNINLLYPATNTMVFKEFFNNNTDGNYIYLDIGANALVKLLKSNDQKLNLNFKVIVLSDRLREISNSEDSVIPVISIGVSSTLFNTKSK